MLEELLLARILITPHGIGLITIIAVVMFAKALVII